jgi:hypothetical protein
MIHDDDGGIDGKAKLCSLSRLRTEPFASFTAQRSELERKKAKASPKMMKF